MTVETNADPVAASPEGAVRKGRKLLWTLALIVGAVAVVGWIGLAASLPLELDRSWRLGFAIVAAVATEATFWMCAAALGVSVFEARKRIWRKITGRG